MAMKRCPICGEKFSDTYRQLTDEKLRLDLISEQISARTDQLSEVTEEINTLKESARLQQSIKMESEPQPYQPTVITVKTVVDSMGIYLTYKDRFKESVETREIETIIEKEVNILYWWQKLLMWIGIIFSLLCALKLYFLLKR